MSRRDDRLCGPECRYRSLYEGSQTSLNDLASKQGEALSRVGRLRNGIIASLKRSFPRPFAAAEAAAGQRLASVDDDVLLAYLSALLDAGRSLLPQAGPPSLGELRAALRVAGVAVPDGDDVTSWVRALAARTHSVPSPAGAAELAALFDEPTPPAAHGRRPLAPSPATVPSPGPVAPATPPAPVPLPASLPAPARRPEPDQGNVQPGWIRDDPSDPGPSEPSEEWDEGGLGGLFDDEAPSPDAPAPTAAPLSPVVPAPAPSPAPVPEAATGPGGDGQGPLRPQMLFPTTSAGKTSRRKPARVTRTQAQPPDARSFDVPPEPGTDGSAELTEEMRKAILARVAIPRPVFTSDLVSLAGTAEAVSAWESECRAAADSPVRFIPPKARHRLRGSLVLPYDHLRSAATEFTRSWWAGCLERYRGARLYELGVLLHRLGEEVVSHRLGENTVLLRLSERRGLTGVVVVVESKLGAGESTRAAIVADLEELLSERLQVVTVLCTSADVVEAVTEAITAEARARQWAPAMSVVVGRSWEYADSQAALVQVLPLSGS